MPVGICDCDFVLTHTSKGEGGIVGVVIWLKDSYHNIIDVLYKIYICAYVVTFLKGSDRTSARNFPHHTKEEGPQNNDFFLVHSFDSS